MNFEFTGKVWFWKGPAPFFFVTVPQKESRELKAISGLVTYGWGVIPVHVRIGKTEWQTSLFPKDGRYHVPDIYEDLDFYEWLAGTGNGGSSS